MSFRSESQICPNCREVCKCFVREISEGVSYYDEYILYCKNCARILAKAKVEKGSTLLATRVTECPFCGVNSKYHERTPKELLQNPAAS